MDGLGFFHATDRFGGPRDRGAFIINQPFFDAQVKMPVKYCQAERSVHAMVSKEEPEDLDC